MKLSLHPSACTPALLIAGMISIAGIADRAFGAPLDGSIDIEANLDGGFHHYSKVWGKTTHDGSPVSDFRTAGDIHFSASGGYAVEERFDPDGHFIFSCKANATASIPQNLTVPDVKSTSAQVRGHWQQRFRIDAFPLRFTASPGHFASATIHRAITSITLARTAVVHLSSTAAGAKSKMLLPLFREYGRR